MNLISRKILNRTNCTVHINIYDLYIVWIGLSLAIKYIEAYNRIRLAIECSSCWVILRFSYEILTIYKHTKCADGTGIIMLNWPAQTWFFQLSKVQSKKGSSVLPKNPLRIRNNCRKFQCWWILIWVFLSHSSIVQSTFEPFKTIIYIYLFILQNQKFNKKFYSWYRRIVPKPSILMKDRPVCISLAGH